MNIRQHPAGSAPASQIFPAPALRLPEERSRRLSPAALLGKAARLRAEPVARLTPGETAFLEALDLARAYPGETAHLLAGIRAGLYAAGVGRKAA